MADKTTYPFISESNWWALRSQFQKTIPNLVTISYLKSLLGFTSDQAAQNLVQPLKRIGLIDEDNKPTSRANDWRSDAKYKETCRKMLEEIYPQELVDLYSGPDIDRGNVKQWFMHTAALGDSAAYKTAALYLLLNDGEVKAADESKKVKGRGQPSKASLKSAPKLAKPEIVKADSESTPIEKVSSEPSNRQSQTTSNHPTLHIDLQIHISPEATSEQIDAIFASMAKHLYKS